MRILLFGGTTEGRQLALWLQQNHIPVMVSTATPYGGALLPQGVEGQVGRLTPEDMADLMTQGGFTHVVDATHPYATAVTSHIVSASHQVGLPYFRLVREGQPEGDWLTARDMTQAAQLASGLLGNILLTTGSKELTPFCGVGLKERTFPRVLPMVTSLEACLQGGFSMGHILCMQGPFSTQMNSALIRQFDIKIMVTKASGGTGGFWEKVESAKETGVTLIVIDRPTEDVGFSLEEIKQQLGGLVGDRE